MRRYSNCFAYRVTTAILWFIIRAIAVAGSHCVRPCCLAWELVIDLETANRPLAAYVCRSISPVNCPAAWRK